MRAAAVLLFAFGCGATIAPVVPPQPLAQKVTRPAAVAGSYWEPEPLDLHPSALAAEPITEENVVRKDGAAAHWDDLKTRVLANGFAIAPHAAEGSLASFYRALEQEKIPVVLTESALFLVLHALMEAAIAEIDATLAPELAKLIALLDERLAVEEAGAKPDTAPAYFRAHAVTEIARALVDPKFKPSSEAARSELALVKAHVGIAQSPILERPIDYAVFDLTRGFNPADERLGSFRAAIWLGIVPFEIGSRDSFHAPIAYGRQRIDSRAALLVTRILRADPQAMAAWERIDELGSFVYGPADDLTPRELAKIASNAGVEVRDPLSVLDVVRVDRVRAAAIEQGRPTMADQVPVVDRVTGRPISLVSMRILGASAPPESVGTARLLAPFVAPDSSGHERVLPSAVDIGVWLGSAEARTLLSKAGYSDAVASVVEHSLVLHEPDACHGSLPISFLEALATYVAPSAGDSCALVLSSAWNRHKLDTALAAWAELRHDGTPFAHHAAHPLESLPKRNDNPWVVEPTPESIARLVALVKQIVRGLEARGLMKETNARALANETLALLASALKTSIVEVNGETPPPREDLSSIFERIETMTGPLALPVVADVHVDLRSNRVLEVGTRPLEELWIVMRDPRGGAPTLFAGAHVGHSEIAIAPRLTDETWRRRTIARPEWLADLVK